MGPGRRPNNAPANWDPTNPTDPNYDWGPYDKWVINAVAAGLTPILQVERSAEVGSALRAVRHRQPLRHQSART